MSVTEILSRSQHDPWGQRQRKPKLKRAQHECIALSQRSHQVTWLQFPLSQLGTVNVGCGHKSQKEKKKKPKGTGMRKGGQHCEVKEREGVRRVSLRELSEGRLGLDHREGTRG